MASEQPQRIATVSLHARPGKVTRIDASHIRSAAECPCFTCEYRQGCVIQCSRYTAYLNTPAGKRPR